MAKKEITVVKKEKIPLKNYPYQELKAWSEKFIGLKNRDCGMIFGAYTMKTKTFPPTEWKKEPYEVSEYSVIPDKIPEFDNLVEQLHRMNFGEEKKVEGLQEMAEQIGNW